jgi:transposase
MCKSLFYVGIDVGKDELCAKVEGFRSREFSNDTRGIRELVKWSGNAAMNKRVHFCMEATGVYSRYLASHLLSFENIEISIVNPAQIASYAKAQLRRTKTDSVDAGVILSFAQSQKPYVWKPEPQAVRYLYHLVTQVDTIKDDMQAWSNRQHAHGYAPDLPRAVRNCDKAIIRTLERELKKLEKAIDKLLSEEEQLSDDVNLLCSIKGVAQHSATRIIAYSKGAMTDRSARALVAHTGLAPRHHRSGSSVRGKSRIAKQGDGRLRKTLYMPALVATVHNPIIRNFYRRLLENGKPKKLALTACMKKLLLIARAMMISRNQFDPLFRA